MNNHVLTEFLDVLTEIFLHMPVHSLLRCRAVCKFWCKVIDSPSFRKLHNYNNNNDKSIFLECRSYLNARNIIVRSYLERSLSFSYKSEYFEYNESAYWDGNKHQLRAYGPVKGLICFDCTTLSKQPIAICNPVLGQLKLLPFTTPLSCQISWRSIAVAFVDEDYKVVQLLSCRSHHRIHAHVYLGRTDSWRELADNGMLDDLELVEESPIKSKPKYNGYFAHWRVHRMDSSWEILKLDMKNEVFETIRIPMDHKYSMIFAEDECSFVRFDLLTWWMKIYESRCEGRELSWIRVKSYEQEYPFCDVHPYEVKDTMIFLEYRDSMFMYDYHKKYIVCKVSTLRKRYYFTRKFIVYSGSFVSLENF